MNKMIIFFCLFAVLFFTANIAWSHDYHYHEQTVISQSVEKVESNESLAIASGQHHYKATTHLQWSIGVGHINDSSAVSFGLGLQAGKVFVSGNLGSNGNTSAIGIGASGTF